VIGRRKPEPEAPTTRVTVHEIVTAGITELEWNPAQRETYVAGVLTRCQNMDIEITEDFAGRPWISEVDARRVWSEIAAATAAQREREEAERERARLAERDRGAGRLELNPQELLQVRGMAQFLAENPDKVPQVWDDDDPEAPINKQRPVISMQAFGPSDTR
jgi:hypothetical protein